MKFPFRSLIMAAMLAVINQKLSAQTIFPRAAATPDSAISHININGKTFHEIFTVMSLQGNVNRTKPRIFVVGNGIVEAVNYTSTQYWLDKLTGYTKTEYINIYSLIDDFSADISGCVLYHPAVFTYPVGGFYPPGFQVSDDNLAKINVTTMLAAKHNAVILTEAQRNELITNYGLTLPILADSRNLASDWLGLYTWAMTNLAPDLRTDITNHLSHFCLGTLDYIISQKIFTYNNYRGTKTSAIEAMEQAFLDISPPNSPVIGVWYLQSDEGSFVQKITENGKFMTVTYESFNLSWSTGLPLATLPVQPRRSLTFDPAKVYLSITRTDGDNMSFLDRVFPGNFDHASRTDYPTGWEMLSTVNELNPTVAAYYYDNIENSNFVTPVSGVGYTAPLLPQEFRQTFMEQSDQYMLDTDCRVVRTLWQDFKQALPYSYLKNTKGILVGYNVGDVSVANNASANMIACGKAFMKTYDISELSNIKNYSGTTPAFFNVSVSSMAVNDIVTQLNTLPSHFEVVTPEELVDLYLQYKDDEGIQYKDFTEITIEPTEDAAGEALHLYDYGFSSFDFPNHARFADLNNFFVYKLSLDPNVTSVSVDLTMYNNYLVQAGQDPFNWTEVTRSPADVHDGTNLATHTFDLTPYLNDNHEIYIRFGDASPTDGWGGALVKLELTTSSATLPVKFLPLKISKSETDAKLSWGTVTGPTDDYFEVMRGNNPKKLESIGKVYAKDFAADETFYDFTDSNPPGGNNYYRIKGVDKAGETTFTNIVAAGFHTIREASIYPNPAKSSIHFAYKSTQNNPAEIILFNKNGIPVSKKAVSDKEGQNTYEFGISGLKPGIYMLLHKNGAGTATYKFIKE
ncbi:T9SS type A sorting domain-containing protein [Dyadobacter bucti]|uniref:T9SS type A sorting domain-containing protein n=1 Tax=Dyadobacter bucti TaxID=2572203 RepID=UPI001107CC14|nr:T9SS type A sorting domain-containing protein [Dyadobacter bucti]